MFRGCRSVGHTKTPWACVRLPDVSETLSGSTFLHHRLTRRLLVIHNDQPRRETLGDVVINNEHHEHHEKHKANLQHRFLYVETQIAAHYGFDQESENR